MIAHATVSCLPRTLSADPGNEKRCRALTHSSTQVCSFGTS